MWANCAIQNTAGWRPFKTAYDNADDRQLRVGDVFRITVFATRAYGEIGLLALASDSNPTGEPDWGAQNQNSFAPDPF